VQRIARPIEKGTGEREREGEREADKNRRRAEKNEQRITIPSR
jgi:hypothetical protein